MRAVVDRGRVLLVLLFAVLVGTGATASAEAPGFAARTHVAGMAPDTAATHHDLRDWLRLPVTARHALSTPAPDSWWAVCANTTGPSSATRRSLARVVAGTAVATGVAAAPSTRAPPARVS
ncbi:hypothetical protein [Actinophytocola oryzae]|uniref:Uncharacterized protein n=1 Tax=Actinophytocola oryzae TaxID=502181 RepID=A0A4R7UQK9_9PSEU|nr:hypothetical protein [Actinophytocola oryzae]TDV35308.1 hypothetical protein CLV71_13623 [Actinophytocola oryzae]